MTNHVTPISPAQFAGASNGSRIIDADGGVWFFRSEPTDEILPFSRSMKNCLGVIETVTYTTIHDQNNLVDEEYGIILELNHPDVRLVP